LTRICRSFLVVLQSRSQYFTQLFQGSTQDVTLEITNFSHHIFSQFVRWVYGGKKEIAPEDAQELARCALFFQAAELVTLCNKIMEENASQQPQQQQQAVTAAPSPVVAEDESMEMEEPTPFPSHQQQQQQTIHQHQLQHFDTQHDPVIAGLAVHGDEMIDFIESPLSNADQDPYSGNYVSADTQYTDFGFGMNVWSNDPVLFPSESTDAYRIMEIC